MFNWRLCPWLQMLTLQKKVCDFSVTSRDVTNQTLTVREWFKYFPAWVSLVSDIPVGDGKIANYFYSVESSSPEQQKGAWRLKLHDDLPWTFNSSFFYISCACLASISWHQARIYFIFTAKSLHFNTASATSGSIPSLSSCKPLTVAYVLYSSLYTRVRNYKWRVFFLKIHCNENPIYVFLFWELRDRSPNFHIHVSVSDLYTPRICPHISCCRI